MVKIECTNQNIKDALGKYANEPQDDWDLHLQAVVYGINIAKQVRVFLWKPISNANFAVLWLNVLTLVNKSYKLGTYSRDSLLSFFPTTPPNS